MPTSPRIPRWRPYLDSARPPPSRRPPRSRFRRRNPPEKPQDPPVSESSPCSLLGANPRNPHPPPRFLASAALHVALAQWHRRLGAPSDPQVQDLDEEREGHREVD